MNLMEIYRSINDFSSGPHRILCPLQVHTTQQIKKKFWLSTGCDKKKTALQVHAQSLPIPTAAKKSIAPSRSKDTLTNQFQYIFFSLFFFFSSLTCGLLLFLFQKLYTLPDECVNFMLYVSWGGVFCLLFACTTQSIHQFQLFNIKFYSK